VTALLAADSRVDGIVLFGSATEEDFDASSDYDLAIIASVPGVPIAALLTRLDQRLCDIVFVDASEVRRWVDSGDLPRGNYWSQGLRRWVVEGQVLFERDQLLTRLRKLSASASWFVAPSDVDLHGTWFGDFYRLKQLRRRVLSMAPATQLYVDLRLGFFIHQAVLDYFLVRNYPWTGLRRALSWIEQGDPEFFVLARSCIEATDRAARWQRCAALVDYVMRPVGTWPDGSSGILIKPDTPVNHETMAQATGIIAELFGFSGTPPDE
jgi:predicted nucleotidyltransferase